MNISVDIHNPTTMTREREVYEADQYHPKFWLEWYRFATGSQTVEVKIYYNHPPNELEDGPVYVG